MRHESAERNIVGHELGSLCQWTNAQRKALLLLHQPEPNELRDIIENWTVSSDMENGAFQICLLFLAKCYFEYKSGKLRQQRANSFDWK